MAAAKKTTAKTAAPKAVKPANPDEMVARIKPTNARESHSIPGCTIRAVDGWVVVSPDLVEALREEPMNDLNPEGSVKVFDVCTRAEAAKLDAAAAVRADPAGTAANPKRSR